MTDISENILDLDQIKDDALDMGDLSLNKGDSSDTRVKDKKKKPKKNQQSRGWKNQFNPLLLSPNDKPKLSREERKNLQLLELFEKLEQKEKKKEENSRKKRKLNSEKSPNLSVTHTDSNQNEENEKQQDNGENVSPKSDDSTSIREKTPIAKKPEPIKVNSKYFNVEFDLGGSRNLISYLYEYQKENTKKYFITAQNKLNMDSNAFGNPGSVTEGGLLSTAGTDRLNALNSMLKQKNDKLFEHLKKFEHINATKDLRHAFYNFDFK